MCNNKVVKSKRLDTIGIKRIPQRKETENAYHKKRRAKALTKAAMYKMFGLQSPINGDYRQAFMCNEYLFQNGNKITSNYCQKKCCTVCNRIKSAQNLAKYGKRILELDGLFLVSLTDKNVYKGQLEDNVKSMYDSLAKIKRNINKNYKELKLNGYRSFECTYTLEKGFNPHFHFIVQGKESAQLLVRLWLNQFPNANRLGQDIREVKPTQKSLLEVFKYIAKPITSGYYSAGAYDEIMRVAKHHRTTEPLGCIRGKREENNTDDLGFDDLKAEEINFKGHRVEVWKYVHDLYDYISPSGELLLGTPLDTKTKNSINVIQRSETGNEGYKKSERQIVYDNRGNNFAALF